MKFTSLQESYEELKTSHDNLKETHEKLEEAHNTLLAHENKAKLSMDVSGDLINEKCCASSSTNPSCSSSDFSCSSDKFSCDESLIEENELLKKEVISRGPSRASRMTRGSMGLRGAAAHPAAAPRHRHVLTPPSCL